MSLFGTDGVRGKAGETLTVSMALNLAMSAGIYFHKQAINKKILLGKDTRKSGYMIENAIVAGLTAVGYNVVQVGPMPTPAIAFLTQSMRCDAGIMITASHNPFEDNGIKFFDSKGNKLSKKVEREIELIYNDEEKIAKSQAKKKQIGRSKRIEDAIGRYIVHIKNSFPIDLSLNNIRIVLDVANGASYIVAPTILEELGAEVIVINDKPNGTNINELCGATNPEELSKNVQKYRANIGFALDGDADRLVAVDEEGNIIQGDHLIGALAKYLKEEKVLKNNKTVVTIMSNLGLKEFLQKEGISLECSDVGDKNVFELMQKISCNFGGEQSGHIIFSDFAKTGDGLVTALKILALMVKEKKKASKILRPFTLYPQKLENIVIKEKKPLEELKDYKLKLKDLEKNNIAYLIRYSGTENILRVSFEAKDKNLMDIKMKEFINYLKKELNV